MTPPQEKPQAGSSGDVPEEGILVIGDDISMGVIAPEDCPAGQDVEVDGSEVVVKSK